MPTTKPDMLLWLSDARGVFIPRDFAKSFVDRDDGHPLSENRIFRNFRHISA